MAFGVWRWRVLAYLSPRPIDALLRAGQAALDLYKGKQGAGYALARSVLDTGAGASATAMATLATMVARPSLALAAGGLTILSLAARFCPVAYSIAEKTGIIQSARIQTGTPAGQVAVDAGHGLDAQATQSAQTLEV